MNLKLIAAGMLLGALAGPVAGAGNLADVTVYDRAENRTLPVYHHNGRHYVVGTPGNEYQIRVRNRTGADVLTVVSVDGVNAVSGETASWDQTGYVLGRFQTYDVKGWRKSEQRVAAFFFTEHQNSYAARTGRPDNVGAIGVALFRRKPQEPAPAISQPYSGAQKHRSGDAAGPAAARAGELASAAPEAPLGTGHGRTETSHARHVGFERATSEPAETVVIYYDSYANLLARGIVPRQPAPRPGPNPFPGFVPDPPA